MTNLLPKAFDAICANLMGKNSPFSVTFTSDQVQAIISGYVVVVGLHSLRCTVVTKSNNTAITFSPIELKLPGFNQNISTTLSIFSLEETLNQEYPGLHVDGGEVFQLSTLYNCNFESVAEILPKYKEVLTCLKTRSRSLKANDTMIDAALENIDKALLQYEAEM